MRSTIRGSRAKLLNGPLSLDESRQLRTRLRLYLLATPLGLRAAVGRALGIRRRYHLPELIAGHKPLYRATHHRINRLLTQYPDPIALARLGLVGSRGFHLAVRRAAALHNPDLPQDSTT